MRHKFTLTVADVIGVMMISGSLAFLASMLITAQIIDRQIPAICDGLID